MRFFILVNIIASMFFTNLLVLFISTRCLAKDKKLSAREIIKESGVKGGLVVYIGNGEGEVLTDFYVNQSYLVQGLYTSVENVLKTRKYLKEKKIYGKISVQHWKKGFLPYADNMVNLIVVETPGNIPMEEITRVLTPRGISYIKTGKSWKKTIKPLPKEIDEWTHFLHGPDNNAVAEDTIVGIPKHVQWIGDPKFARSHEQLASLSSMVSTKGRLFYIIDKGQTSDIRLPARWQLVARDAFNGVVLWTREINNWADHMHGFRTGPPDLAFRLVAVDERVYVCLDQNKPVVALEASTGKTIRTYKSTENARQIIYADNILVMLCGTSQVDIHIKPKDNKTAKRSIITADPETGAILWQKEIDIDALLPLVVSKNSLLYQTTSQLVCFDLKSGKEKWQADHPLRLAKLKSKLWNWASPTLTAQNDIVYVADFKSLSAISIKDGKVLWNTSSQQGFNSPPDIFLINGLMWRGYAPKRGSADFGQGLNAKTGKLEKEIATEKAWEYATLAHFRCYRPKATSRFILSSRSGVEFIDIDSGEIRLNHWVRGTCQYGILPCNGLLYAPPNSCACNIKTMLRGLCALAPSNPDVSNLQQKEVRLIKGPAFGKITKLNSPGNPSEDWPVFRHDNQRTGKASTKVSKNFKKTWKTKIGEKLSSPVVSKGRIYISEIDAHAINAIDAKNGKILWSFTTGARIDSPPTVYKNMILFGSVDGWVYCLRETDGTLIWQYRGAPKERMIVVRGQLESTWPIHGSVLIHNDTLIAAAGRSSYIDLILTHK